MHITCIFDKQPAANVFGVVEPSGPHFEICQGQQP